MPRTKKPFGQPNPSPPPVAYPTVDRISVVPRAAEAGRPFVPDINGWRGLIRRIAAATRSSEPEDLLVAAFIRLEEYSERAEVQNPKAFLFRTAVNLAHDEYRQRRGKHYIDCREPTVLNLSDEQPLQDEVFAARERLRKVQTALAALHPRTREIFLMHRVERLKYREIAEQHRITVSAVEKHIAKAVLFLAARMKAD
jgi:RNA polymerase sigma-70 factor (ECF subfamily)